MGFSLATDHSTSEAISTASALGGLLQGVLAVVVVTALIFWALRLLAKRGMGPFAPGFAQIEQRSSLGGTQALLIVRVEGRRLLLATHPGSPARLLLELSGTTQGETFPREDPRAEAASEGPSPDAVSSQNLSP